MDSNLPTPPKDVETLRTELKRSEQTGTLFIGIWHLARYALATLEWADTLAKQVADQIATILDLRSQLRDAQEIAQGLVAKAEQWQKQLEWHYEDKPNDSKMVMILLVNEGEEPYHETKGGYWYRQGAEWYVDGYGWLSQFPLIRVVCWQRINLPLELQVQDTNE